MTTVSAAMPERDRVERVLCRRRRCADTDRRSLPSPAASRAGTPALRKVGVGVGELEVDGGQADHAGARHMRDLHARRLEREDAGLRAFRMRRKVDEDVEIVLRDAHRGLALVSATRGPRSGRRCRESARSTRRFPRQRIEEELEARLGRDGRPPARSSCPSRDCGGPPTDSRSAAARAGASRRRGIGSP